MNISVSWGYYLFIYLAETWELSERHVPGGWWGQSERGSFERSKTNVTVNVMKMYLYFGRLTCRVFAADVFSWLSLRRKIVSGKKDKGSGVTGQKVSEARPTDRGWMSRWTWCSCFGYSICRFFWYGCVSWLSLGRKIVGSKKDKGSGVTGQKESEPRPTDCGWTAILRQDARAWQYVGISARRGLQWLAPSD